MTLARFLQGRLDQQDRDDFTGHLVQCDACLGELAFALRSYQASPISKALFQKLTGLFDLKKSQEDTLGRSADVYGEASTSGEQAGLKKLDHELLPKATQNHPRRAPQGTASDEQTPAFKTAALKLPFPNDSSNVPQPKEPKVSLGRSLLFAFIGAGLVLILAVVPLFRISKDLFLRARKSEIRVAKAIKVHEKMTKNYAQATSHIKALEAELKKRPTMEAVNRYQNTARIWKSQFKRSQDASQRLKRGHKLELEQLKQRTKNALDGLEQQLRKEQTENFPNRFFQSIAGKAYPKVPDNKKLIELIKTSNDEIGVAAFFMLQQRGLGSLAISLANKRSKLSLLNFLGRPYLASLPTEIRHWDMLSALLHNDASIRVEAVEVLKAMNIECHGYKLDLNNKQLNDVVSTMAADWNRRFNKSKGPYNLPYRDEASD
jgi:hypothetical protein